MTGHHFLHPIIVGAASGRLPAWAQVRPGRLPHLASVAGLLQRWGEELGLDECDRARWAAAGWLHDALRDADPAELEAEAGEFPKKIRHGPAVAVRLRTEGVDDEELLQAITYHSLGCRGLRPLGRYLYLADYLEPQRTYFHLENAVLRSRLPEEPGAVLRTVCARRIAERLDRGKPLRQETVDFWDDLVRGA